MFAIAFPNINPIAVKLGPFSIHWYSLAYLIGIVAGIQLIKFLDSKYQKPFFDKKSLDDLLISILIGIVIGGRLGYVLFYDLNKAIKDPIWIFQTWKGGMSFHGGLIGVGLAGYLYCKKYKYSLLKLMDLISCTAPIGLFMGRIANFINGELYGRETSVPWAVIFPESGNIARHPSQLYEAFLEGAVLEIIMMTLFFRTKIRNYYGYLSGIFLFLYSLFRITIEFYRQPDNHIGFLFTNFSLGQLLSLPFLLLGAVIILYYKTTFKKLD